MKVSNQFSIYLVQNHIITEEDKEIVSFGIEQMGITFVNIITFLGMGLLLHTFYETIFFLLVFASVRRYAGGYHAPTRRRCFLYSIIIVGTSLFLIKYIYMNRVFCVISSWIAGSVIVTNSPVEDRNKPLNAYEVCAYWKRAVLLSLMWIVLLNIMAVMKQDIYVYIIWTAMVWIAILLVMGKIKNFKLED